MTHPIDIIQSSDGRTLARVTLPADRAIGTVEYRGTAITTVAVIDVAKVDARSRFAVCHFQSCVNCIRWCAADTEVEWRSHNAGWYCDDGRWTDDPMSPDAITLDGPPPDPARSLIDLDAVRAAVRAFQRPIKRLPGHFKSVAELQEHGEVFCLREELEAVEAERDALRQRVELLEDTLRRERDVAVRFSAGAASSVDQAMREYMARKAERLSRVLEPTPPPLDDDAPVEQWDIVEREGRRGWVRAVIDCHAVVEIDDGSRRELWHLDESCILARNVTHAPTAMRWLRGEM